MSILSWVKARIKGRRDTDAGRWAEHEAKAEVKAVESWLLPAHTQVAKASPLRLGRTRGAFGIAKPHPVVRNPLPSWLQLVWVHRCGWVLAVRPTFSTPGQGVR